MEKKKVLVCIAPGFEEVEAFTPVDYLRRAGADVTVAGVGCIFVKGSHDIRIETDKEISTVEDEFDMVVCPGGMPGAVNLSKSWEVNKFLVETSAKGGYVAAICASPAVVLGPVGLLEGKKAVCYPGCEKFWPDGNFLTDRVMVDGNIITSRSAGTASEFALTLVELLFGKEEKEELAKAVLNA